MSNPRIILSTVDSPDAAEGIARKLVGARLASCVNILPGLRSIYRWNSEIHDEPELLLIIKTSSEKSDEAIKALVDSHPYELPEAIALEIGGGHLPYLDWIRSETGG